jgi:hypothetical protein
VAASEVNVILNIAQLIVLAGCACMLTRLTWKHKG